MANPQPSTDEGRAKTPPDKPQPANADPGNPSKQPKEIVTEIPPLTAANDEQPNANAANDNFPLKTPPSRTPGMWGFDILAYPVATNTGVFVSSVAFTYLTNHGKEFGPENSRRRAFGKLMNARGTWVMGGLQKRGIPEAAAKHFTSVIWSFLDGTILLPLTKIMEDNREAIAQKIDRQLGTESTDPSVYKSEPNQTWLSLLGARAVVAGIVAPTAGVLNHVTWYNGELRYGGNQKLKEQYNLNEHFLGKPGKALGNWAKQQPFLTKRLSDKNIDRLSYYTAFEAFYTSVCTAGLYGVSRAFAYLGEKGKSDNDNDISVPKSIQKSAGNDNQAVKSTAKDNKPDTDDTPPKTIQGGNSSLQGQVSAPQIAVQAGS